MCIFFTGSQRRFASAIEATVYISRHRWKYRSSPFRVNSGIVLLRASLLYICSSIKQLVSLTYGIYMDAFYLTLNLTRKLYFYLISGELTEMMGDLFIGHDMPEPPKESFFKGLFGGGARSLDREELCK